MIKIPNKIAREASYIEDSLPYAIMSPEYFAPITVVVENRPTGQTTRWDEIRELVVKIQGSEKLWRATYRVGLTENQDYPPFDYGGDVEFKSVERKTRMVEEVYYE